MVCSRMTREHGFPRERAASSQVVTGQRPPVARTRLEQRRSRGAAVPCENWRGGHGGRAEDGRAQAPAPKLGEPPMRTGAARGSMAEQCRATA
jgi:hypothetical protein